MSDVDACLCPAVVWVAESGPRKPSGGAMERASRDRAAAQGRAGSEPLEGEVPQSRGSCARPGSCSSASAFAPRLHPAWRGPGLGGPFIGGKSRFAAKRVVQYICTLHFCTSSTRCWTVLCSSSSCVRLSKSRWTAGKIETCRCTGRQRPAAGVARRVQTRQWSRRERAADAAT